MRTHSILVASAVLAFIAVAVRPSAARDDDDRKGDYRRGGGRGDPVMAAFDGTVFDFSGMPGNFYNLVSDYPHYQLATKLKPAHLTGHNGTYMEGIGFRYKGIDIIVDSTETNMRVSVGGEPLLWDASGQASKSLKVDNKVPVTILLRKFWPELGQAVQINTEEIEVLISMTAAGTKDFGGLVQPAYLNFNVTLASTPTTELQGVIGETYNYMADARKASSHRFGAKTLPMEEAKYPLYPHSAYELANYFAPPRVEIATVPHHISERARIQRSLIAELASALEPQAAKVAFPLSASGWQ